MVKLSQSRRSRDDLWVVSCYFNPCHYARRLTNYRIFRERLGLPLLTIELSNDGEFELDESDADRILRCQAPDVLWQKERLLNIAIASLHPSCEKVAWFDGDVFLGRDDWPQEAIRLLDEYSLVQLFSHCTDLARDVTDPDANVAPTGRGFVFQNTQGGHVSELFDSEGVQVSRRLSSGFAWAARREVVEEHGLYDACIVGSGDRAIACAVLDHSATANLYFLHSEAQRRHFRAWAIPFSASIAGRVSFLEGPVYHLWHGELSDRRYRDRWRELASFEFNPESDITVDTQSCWRWSSNKPAMHEYVRRYFEQRREDGPLLADG